MKHAVLATVIAVALAPAALAQTKTPAPATGTASMDSAAEAKFKAADKNANGTLEGAEADAYKANMAKIDTDKDGKVSRAEFAAAARSGVIK